MKGQPAKPQLLTEESRGAGCAVTRIADNGMAGKPGMAPDLMLAAGHQIAFDEGVTGAAAKNPEAGFSRYQRTLAFGTKAAPGTL